MIFKYCHGLQPEHCHGCRSKHLLCRQLRQEMRPAILFRREGMKQTSDKCARARFTSKLVAVPMVEESFSRGCSQMVDESEAKDMREVDEAHVA